jgi:hypothetical protein
MSAGRVSVATAGSLAVAAGGVALGDTPAPYDFTWAFVLLPGSYGHAP